MSSTSNEPTKLRRVASKIPSDLNLDSELSSIKAKQIIVRKKSSEKIREIHTVAR